MTKPALSYLAIIGLSIVLIGMVLRCGEGLNPISDHAPVMANAQAGPAQQFVTSLETNFHHPAALLFLQIVIILVAARMVGALFTRFGQPAVIGEVIAGIAMGPSLIGGIFPQFLAVCFPKESLSGLQLVSQFGLVLFMFIVGMELNVEAVRKKAVAALMISHAGIVTPFLLGVAASLWLYGHYSSPGISFTAFALFMGVAMSITAFPVLARIINERGLGSSPLGSLVMTCAAIDDITAWCLLAAVVAFVHMGTAVQTVYLLIALGVFVFLMIRVVRPLLARWSGKFSEKNPPGQNAMAVVFGLLFVSVFFTELIGIRALFGAFLLGVIMPQGTVRLLVMEKMRDLAMLVLLPIFFMISGLRTQFGLLSSGLDWLACALIILVAVAGKFGGTMLAARFSGQTWRDSSVIGALMNTRGLVELIVLNIGYEMGILEPRIFSMMVIMALVTTFMAGPYLNLVDSYERRRLGRTFVPNP